jgi:hypothetical protein
MTNLHEKITLSHFLLPFSLFSQQSPLFHQNQTFLCRDSIGIPHPAVYGMIHWRHSLRRLASAGISAIWFPSPAKGAGGGFSMGYDPYDHYDFGEFLQKGSKETRFGSRQELVNAISTFHSVGIQVYADAVMRHMMGGESQARYECIPLNNGTQIVADSAYMVFNYPNGSGRFKKSQAEFYPNSEHCFVDPKIR